MNGVRRGGAHEQVSRSVRCSWRFARLRDNPSATFGFRLVCEWCNKGRQSIYYGY